MPGYLKCDFQVYNFVRQNTKNLLSWSESSTILTSLPVPYTLVGQILNLVIDLLNEINGLSFVFQI